MKMEKDINNMELEEMKQQLSELKSKLDKETIVNDRLMRKAMKAKVSTINRDALITALVALIGIPYCTWIFGSMMDISWLFIIVTDIFFLTAAIYTYLSRKDIKANDLLEGDLLNVSQKMIRMNRMNANWLKFSIPFLIVWLTWLVFCTSYETAFLIGGAIGLAIGLPLGIHQYRKTRRMANEIIDQISELKESK
jgi:hypothetical protein